MDILTKRGQYEERVTRHVMRVYKERFPYIQIVDTNFEKPAVIDYILSNDEGLVCLVEFKNRWSGINYTDLTRNKGIFLDVDKFEPGVQMGRWLCTTFCFFVYLPEDQKLVSFRVYDSETDTVIDHRDDKTKTATSVNNDSKRYKPHVVIPGKQHRLILDDIPPYERSG